MYEVTQQELIQARLDVSLEEVDSYHHKVAVDYLNSLVASKG
jgi:hypothetical protein